MAGEHEHQVTTQILDLQRKVAGLARSPELDDIRASIEVLIKVLSVGRSRVVQPTRIPFLMTRT
jgi:hypothetical protein